MVAKTQSIHANCLRLGALGLLILGPTGTGKSTITLALLERAGWSGRDAKLISDDYTQVFVENGRLIGQVPESLRGGIEVRGAGLYAMDYENRVAIDHVVALGQASERFPNEKYFSFEDVQVPMLSLPSLNDADGLAICHAIEVSCFGTGWNKKL